MEGGNIKYLYPLTLGAIWMVLGCNVGRNLWYLGVSTLPVTVLLL